MTWNVRYFGHGTLGLRTTDNWLRRVALGVASLPVLPDLLALQEVEDISLRGGLGMPQLDRFTAELDAAMERLGREHSYKALYFPAHRYKLGVGPALYTTGLAMLVSDRLVIEDHNADDPHPITWVASHGLKRLKQTRIVGHVRVRPQDGTSSLDLFNTHLSLPAFTEVGPHRIPSRMGWGTNQLREAESLLEFLESRRGEAAVVVGDFNARPGSPAYERLTRDGWVDAYAEVNQLHPDALHDLGTARFGAARMHIDHVFSTAAVHWLDVHTHGIDAGPTLGLSDHAPKTGMLRLR